MSVKEPFTLPKKGKKSKNSVEQVRKEFSQGSLSDHKMLLNVFLAWSEASKKAEFIRDNSIHHQNMEMIAGIRSLIMRYLKTEQFISDHSVDLNDNSQEWSVVKACLIAGLYRKYCSNFII